MPFFQKKNRKIIIEISLAQITLQRSKSTLLPLFFSLVSGENRLHVTLNVWTFYFGNYVLLVKVVVVWEIFIFVIFFFFFFLIEYCN